jgi:hypothetical protein
MSEGLVTKDKVLGSFQKSVGASVLVSVVDWQDDTYLDIREVLPSDKPGETFVFTKKGVRFRSALVGELVALLAQVK